MAAPAPTWMTWFLDDFISQNDTCNFQSIYEEKPEIQNEVEGAKEFLRQCGPQKVLNFLKEVIYTNNQQPRDVWLKKIRHYVYQELVHLTSVGGVEQNVKEALIIKRICDTVASDVQNNLTEVNYTEVKC